jgi:HD-GYP domain-containing protein (c-di-GMP phosphodiesterase class II)
MHRRRQILSAPIESRLSSAFVEICQPEEWHELLTATSARRSEELSAGIQDPLFESDTERILFALAQVVEQRDALTAGHCERLSFISVALGVTVGLDRGSLLALYRGGYLHDVGKVGLPDSILFKRGKLNEDEWVLMRSHTTRGEEICRHLRSLKAVLPIIRHHHECWDGSGYPDGLRGEQIPLLSRILQVADIYDALTACRPYKPAFTAGQALEIMRQETERGWRDPRIFKLFLRLHEDVLSKMAGFSREDRSNAMMRHSLVNLQRSLSADSLELKLAFKQNGCGVRNGGTGEMDLSLAAMNTSESKSFISGAEEHR